VLEVAAAALGDLPDGEVPPALAQVRRFAPARRASAGALPLAMALERDEAFRARVAAAARVRDPETTSALEHGSVPGAADPVQIAALAYLVRSPGWPDLVEAARSAARERADREAGRRGADELATLLADLAAARSALVEQRAVHALELGAAADEVGELRRELRRHRADADRARAAARAAEQDAEREVAAARSRLAQADLRAERAGAALVAAREEVEALRRADREGRSLASARARLLLDTVVEAAGGLRRELGLAPTQVRPADLVGHDPDAGVPTVAVRARQDDDPALLSDLLALPQVHLVVDGYNLTKGAYGDLPLLDQRSRLVGGLAGLHARTGAEVTVVFDGAAVQGRVAVPHGRGVRVRFSEPGRTADDLVRALVRAEPPGRVVVVVSTDREVADGVRAAGARPVPSAALARLLERG
jgi:predicted RNA-binding protein with PIN domain